MLTENTPLVASHKFLGKLHGGLGTIRQLSGILEDISPPLVQAVLRAAVSTDSPPAEELGRAAGGALDTDLRGPLPARPGEPVSAALGPTAPR